MDQFRDKIAVITGGGTGMGRALACQLASAGCHVAMCDVSIENMEESARLARVAGPGVRVTAQLCDVSVEGQVLAFRDQVLSQHETDHLHLVFNNAGIGGGGSVVADEREQWDKTFAVCWSGVYFCTRAFLPLLIAAEQGHLVNTSSVNGFFASIGPGVPHTAYSAAKFAVRGFTEALITDLRVHAPHVAVSVVMPGHIGTDIVFNSARVLGRSEPLRMSTEEVSQARGRLQRQGFPVADLGDDGIRQLAQERAIEFRDQAPMSADQAAAVILDGVRHKRWRILVGEDAEAIDQAVRAQPERCYQDSFMAEMWGGAGLLSPMEDEPRRSRR